MALPTVTVYINEALHSAILDSILNTIFLSDWVKAGCEGNHPDQRPPQAYCGSSMVRIYTVTGNSAYNRYAGDVRETSGLQTNV